MIKIGQKVRFNPYKDLHIQGAGGIEDEVIGVVNYIHPTNGWFNVKYDGGDGPRLLGFRYDDVGKNVKIVKA